MPLSDADLAQRLSEADRLAERFAERAAVHDRERSFPKANIDELRQAGWPGLVVPTEFGGAGAGLRDVVMLVERLAAGDGSTALAFTMHLQTIGSAAESRSWPADRFAVVCLEIAETGALINACASEPELGSPSRGGLPKTVARWEVGRRGGGGREVGRRGGGRWLITGRKTFASMAPVLDYFIIPAALEGEADTIGRFLVPRGTGVRMIETWDSMGMRATGSHDVVLEAVAVPEGDLLYRQSAAAPDLGPVAPAINAWFTLTITAVYLGIAASAQAVAARFAHARVPTALGRPIATVETIQHRLGEAELQLLAARALLQRVAGDWDRAPERRADLVGDIVAAKLFVTNAAIRITDEAMRVVGGSAMRRDLPLERHYRDVRAGIYHPPADDQGLALLGRIALARHRLPAPDSPTPAEPPIDAPAIIPARHANPQLDPASTPRN